MRERWQIEWELAQAREWLADVQITRDKAEYAVTAAEREVEKLEQELREL